MVVVVYLDSLFSIKRCGPTSIPLQILVVLIDGEVKDDYEKRLND